jgi:hypothetical protein
MGFRSLFVATLALAVSASAASAQYTPQAVDKFIAGLEAERPELDRVGAQLNAIDEKIAAFRRCYEEMDAAARAAGRDLGGISGRVAVRAKCGASTTKACRRIVPS